MKKGWNVTKKIIESVLLTEGVRLKKVYALIPLSCDAPLTLSYTTINVPPLVALALLS